MNFVRAVMLCCFVAAGVLGYMVYQGRAEVAELRDQVYRQAPGLTKEIQNLAVELDQLRKVESGSEFQSVADPELYIRNLATRPDVSLGDVDPTPKKAKVVVPGTEDKVWQIVPAESKRAFSRAKISNYMYILEVESPFVVVTYAEIRPDKKGKPEEHPSDRWTFKVEITTRTPAN
jgi:hypothetical protein